MFRRATRTFQCPHTTRAHCRTSLVFPCAVGSYSPSSVLTTRAATLAAGAGPADTTYVVGTETVLKRRKRKRPLRSEAAQFKLRPRLTYRRPGPTPFRATRTLERVQNWKRSCEAVCQSARPNLTYSFAGVKSGISSKCFRTAFRNLMNTPILAMESESASPVSSSNRTG